MAEMEPFPNTKEDEGAKFNFGIDTLKRISEILREYKNISTRMPHNGDRIIAKHDALKSFYLACSPMLENRRTFKDRIRNIDLTVRRQNGKDIIIYRSTDEDIMDDILDDIQTELQEKKETFMPAKEDDEGL